MLSELVLRSPPDAHKPHGCHGCCPTRQKSHGQHCRQPHRSHILCVPLLGPAQRCVSAARRIGGTLPQSCAAPRSGRCGRVSEHRRHAAPAVAAPAALPPSCSCGLSAACSTQAKVARLGARSTRSKGLESKMATDGFIFLRSTPRKHKVITNMV